jgi:hypothetical protein
VANAPGCTSASAAYCTYPALDVPTFTASRLSPPHPASDPGSQSRNYACEKWPINFAETPTSTKRLGIFTCRKSMTWDPRFYFPSEGRRAEDFFRPEKSDGFGRLNPRTWVPKASALTPRPPKPLSMPFINGHLISETNRPRL